MTTKTDIALTDRLTIVKLLATGATSSDRSMGTLKPHSRRVPAHSLAASRQSTQGASPRRLCRAVTLRVGATGAVIVRVAFEFAALALRESRPKCRTVHRCRVPK